MTGHNNSVIKNLILKIIKNDHKLNRVFLHHSHLRKHSISTYIDHILFVLRFSIPWRHIPTNQCHWNSVYKFYVKLNSHGLFNLSFNQLLNKYLKRTPSRKLKFISVDSTFIPNKLGTNVIGRNGHYNHKNGTKITIIVDSYGIPLDAVYGPGNRHDSWLFTQYILSSSSKWLFNNTKNKKYLLADAGYDSNRVKQLVVEKGYIPIIKSNRRNNKNHNNNNIMDYNQKKIYGKRLVIERTIGKMKNDRRINMRYDRHVDNYVIKIILIIF